MAPKQSKLFTHIQITVEEKIMRSWSVVFSIFKKPVVASDVKSVNNLVLFLGSGVSSSV